MDVFVNNIKFDVPFDVSSITLGKYVEYYEMFGRELDVQLNEILKRDYKKIKAEEFLEIDDTDASLFLQMDLDDHLNNEALAWYSFFTGADLFEVKEQPYIQPLLNQYRVFRYLLKESMEAVQSYPSDFDWRDEIWTIQNFTVNPASEMTFNEIITSREIMRQIHKLSKGKWDAMPYLCAIFFRKKGERFSDELVQLDGERMNLMNELPLDYALRVAFFLTSSALIWMETLVSSESPEVETASLN